MVGRTAGEDRGDVDEDVDADRQARLEEYCHWGLAQVKSDRWRRSVL